MCVRQGARGCPTEHPGEGRRTRAGGPAAAPAAGTCSPAQQEGSMSSQGCSSLGECGWQGRSLFLGSRAEHCRDPSCWGISEGGLKLWAGCSLGGGTWPLREGDTGGQ